MPHITKEIVLEAINKYHPKSLSALRSSLQWDGYQFDDQELVLLLKQLETEGNFTLVRLDDLESPATHFLRYLRDFDVSWWVYFVCIVGFIESGLVLSNNQNPVALVFRALFGVLLLGFAPGYAATRVAFPKVGFPFLERLLLSIFLSLIVSIGIGTLLGAFLVFDARSSTLLIGLSTVSLGLLGAYRGSSKGNIGTAG